MFYSVATLHYYCCIHLLQEVTITDFSPKRIPQSGNIVISIFGSNFNISNPTLAEIRLADIWCEITNQQ